MKTILIANQKGGVGKTLIADELCFEAERRNIKYSLRDYDGQGGLNHEPIEDPEAEILIIDTPGALHQQMIDWIMDSDAIIVPTLMTQQCINPLERMIDILKPVMNSKYVLFALNEWDGHTSCNDFEEWFYNKYPGLNTVEICRADAMRQASEMGISIVKHKPQSKSAMEVKLLFELICARLERM